MRSWALAKGDWVCLVLGSALKEGAAFTEYDGTLSEAESLRSRACEDLRCRERTRRLSQRLIVIVHTLGKLIWHFWWRTLPIEESHAVDIAGEETNVYE